MRLKDWFKKITPHGIWDLPDDIEMQERYTILKRNILALMLVITLVPLFLMALINYHQYRTTLHEELLSPLKAMVNKGKHSCELFLTERLSALNFIASAYSYEELSDPNTLNRIFRVMQQEFSGFVDLGLIDKSGDQVSYSGPYDLKGKNYVEQSWFNEVRVRGVYISDVFIGYRRFPHVALAVQHVTDSGRRWILRATINTDRFDELIAAMGLTPESDAFFLNRQGICQTSSKYYGRVLDECTIPFPTVSYEPNVIEMKDEHRRPIFLAYAFMVHPAYVLVVVKPQAEVFKTWYSLKSELFFVFIGSVGLIFLVVFRLTRVMIKRIQDSDEKRQLAFREMEHAHKLSSLGRMAAGVAHEINNPMAVINEKAGLMKDLIGLKAEFPDQAKFISLLDSILKSVDRCRNITHRLLGFARRMEVQIEVLDLNEVIKEVLTFIEKEAFHRNIDLQLNLDASLPRIASDRGQLQQVFLNILNNAFAAVTNGGSVQITTSEADTDRVVVSIRDDGHGMSEETRKRIFDPFFTTKKGGTGTGLGLPITYGIVKKLGGDITVESKEGAGTTFCIYFSKKPEVTP